MTVRIGLIGGGGIAAHHIGHGYLTIPEQAVVTAVADVNADNARARADEVGGAAVFDDYRRLIAEAPVDAVDVCLPHHLHADAILAAAAAGKHILCEKPLCITLEEAAAIETAIRESGVMLMCAHNQLFLPSVIRAKQMIAAGELGKVYGLRTTDCFVLDATEEDLGWRAARSTSGGGELIDTGYHPSYVLLHLADSQPVEVAAMLSTHRLPLEGEDSAQVLVRFADGAVGTITTSWAHESAPGTERFSVVGELGSLSGTDTSLRFQPVEGEAQAIELPEADEFAAEIAEFVSCVRDGRRPENSEVEGIAVLAVILAAYRSAEDGRVVSLDELQTTAA